MAHQARSKEGQEMAQLKPVGMRPGDPKFRLHYRNKHETSE